MAMGYRPVDREQEFLLPPNMIDWLAADHLVWFVIDAVARLDTTAFHRLARLGGVGRRGYDPDMLVTLLVYAMAHGVSSSRQIERLCHTDIAFRIICAQDVPDHTVLSRFRKNYQDALAGLLTQSLILAAELGMVSLGVVAVDGTKIAGNASKDANRTEKHLRGLAEEYLAAVDATDAAEDDLFGQDRRGDETPGGPGDRTGRRERIQQALEQISQRREQAEKARREHRKQERTRAGDRAAAAESRWQRTRAEAAERYQRRLSGPDRGGARPVPPDEYCRVREARAAYQAARAAAEAADGDTAAAPSPAAHDAPAADKPPTWNLTDPQSRLLKTRNGWIQGYNCQTAGSDDGFILHTRATQDANDLQQFIPTMHATAATAALLAARTGRPDLATIGIMLADAGYDSTDNLTADGCDRLIADGKRHTMARRADTDPTTGDPPADAGPREKMNHRLRTPEGQQLYKRRGPIIETPNAWLKDGRGLRRFTRRGLAAADAELGFAAAVTNLMKILTHGVTAVQLRAG